jgi:hypothetical protein
VVVVVVASHMPEGFAAAAFEHVHVKKLLYSGQVLTLGVCLEVLLVAAQVVVVGVALVGTDPLLADPLAAGMLPLEQEGCLRVASLPGRS